METTENAALDLITSEKNVSKLIDAVKQFPIMKEEDAKFLSEHSEHLGMVLDKCFMWRTDAQKRSILSDTDFPTTHSKFHQAILEQKVQFEQTMYLARDFEQLKLDIQLLECDLDDLCADGDKSKKRKTIEADKIKLDIQYKTYELNQMQVQMNYRMAEIKGWQEIEDELLVQLRNEGYTEDEIWDKEVGEAQFLFLLALNKLETALQSKDSDALKAVIPLALFTYKQAKESGKLDAYLSGATDKQKELADWIGNYQANRK